MNKTVKTVAILLSAGLLLVGCASKEKPKSTAQTSTKATTKATTESSTKAKTKNSSTDEVKEEDSRVGAKKRFSKPVMKQVSQP